MGLPENVLKGISGCVGDLHIMAAEVLSLETVNLSIIEIRVKTHVSLDESVPGLFEQI